MKNNYYKVVGFGFGKALDCFPFDSSDPIDSARAKHESSAHSAWLSGQGYAVRIVLWTPVTAPFSVVPQMDWVGRWKA